MLAVITDDFTGASEIAGIALSRGYTTVIETRKVQRSDADVMVIATDMRSLDRAAAARKSAQLTEQILALEPALIFKKVDSVLRGNIGPELEAQMRIEQKAAALLIPANPSMNRTICDGQYFIDGTPVTESGFALNGGLASLSSSVVDILVSRGAGDAVCISPGDSFTSHGIHIGNTRDDQDLRAWAGAVSNQLVPAGAADFFAALLDSQRSQRPLNGVAKEFAMNGRTLYVCGSNFPSSRDAVAEARKMGVSIVSMPDEIYFNVELNQEQLDRWADSVVEVLSTNSAAIITALQTPTENCISGPAVTNAMASVARQVVKREAIDELMIEGGATSYAVMTKLGIDCLYPSHSLAPGTTRMRVDGYSDLHITMKPGSYRWPDAIWDFNK